MKSKIYLFVATFLFILGTQSQNKLDLASWSTVAGNSSVSNVANFYPNGGSSQSSIQWSTDPFNKKALIWKSVSNSVAQANGGWECINIPVEPTKSYRLSVWIKRANATNNGYLYLGCSGSTTLNLGGNTADNPYFMYIPNTTFQVGKWYLWVGYIHSNIDPDINNYSGIYDGESGLKIISGSDYKLRSDATTQVHRTYNYYDGNAGSTVHWYAPRFDEINGNEPSLEQLLGVTGQSATNNKIGFFSNNVGIGTTTPTEKLSVNGNIRAKKLIVTQQNWSDYVFYKGYKLLPLKEVEKYIQQYQHLPDMPSAKEVQVNGISVGDTQALLLKKIEELTLYVISIQKLQENSNNRIEVLEKENKNLRQRNIK